MKYAHIGWKKDGSTNTDKVWGIILLHDNGTEYTRPGYTYQDNKYLSFWGRRGKKLQTKAFDGHPHDARQMFLKKTRSGYTEVNRATLGTVYPEFEQDLERTAVWALLLA